MLHVSIRPKIQKPARAPRTPPSDQNQIGSHGVGSATAFLPSPNGACHLDLWDLPRMVVVGVHRFIYTLIMSVPPAAPRDAQCVSHPRGIVDTRLI